MLRSLASSVAIAALLLFGACSSDSKADAAPPDAGAEPDAEIDAGVDLTAEFLGEVCAMPTDCPEGYTCLNLVGSLGGFCTHECTAVGDPTCETDYPPANPGVPGCDIMITGPPPQPFCIIKCGDQWNPDLPIDCPLGLTCRDITGVGGPDGLLDFCVP